MINRNWVFGLVRSVVLVLYFSVWRNAQKKKYKLTRCINKDFSLIIIIFKNNNCFNFKSDSRKFSLVGLQK